MADHRDEQILDAVMTTVTGLTTPVSAPVRGRVYPHDDSNLPALTVYMGQSTPVDEGNVRYQDRYLEVRIEAHVKEATETLEQTLNQLKKEVYVAVLANRTLGLPFVHDTQWEGDGEPELQDGSNKPTGSLEMRYRVQYRHSISDPSA